MKTELFTVIRDGLKINGIVYKSELLNDGASDSEKAPALIISHGFQCNYAGFEYYGQRFSEYGFNVFCFNFCGGSSRDDFDRKSDGDSRDMCLTSEIADLTAVFNYVKEQAYVDTNSIYLMGESQGAFVSGLTAAKLKELVKKLVMIYPAVCIPDHARRGTLGGASYDPKNPPEEMVLPLTTIGKKFHDDAVGRDAYSELAKYKGQTLIIQGTDDDIVTPQYQYLVKNVFDLTDEKTDGKADEIVDCQDKSNENSGKDKQNIAGNNTKMQNNHRCRLQMVRNMGHMVSEAYRESVVDNILQFIEDREEIMNFRIICTHVDSLDDNDKIEVAGLAEDEKPVHRQDVFFTGYCESDLFTGCITSGVDHQAYQGNKCIQMSAEYTFSGVDSDGEKCEMRVCNKKQGEHWKPEIRTDSNVLNWLNGAELTAVVEGGDLGPTIRIYM